ncbi:unnamed protein product [Vitrella brassicaformis CCMP3155]|uniref:Uncharacterized protein n=1 Tax=Vitrella brassicaformis (strain CCMP3155) TaxID=1169540 RepID=A0A0G4GNK4_VITBC|nr:unnamed protein product [Vitrella brassicaformis CCMP3155]|eukprot:CEM31866.1 unnamed protein product [Vitrella brassicaformis CCMP3155]
MARLPADAGRIAARCLARVANHPDAFPHLDMATSTGIRLTPGIVFHHLLWFSVRDHHENLHYTVLPEYYIPIVTQDLQLTNNELRTTAEWNYEWLYIHTLIPIWAPQPELRIRLHVWTKCCIVPICRLIQAAPGQPLINNGTVNLYQQGGRWHVRMRVARTSACPGRFGTVQQLFGLTNAQRRALRPVGGRVLLPTWRCAGRPTDGDRITQERLRRTLGRLRLSDDVRETKVIMGY